MNNFVDVVNYVKQINAVIQERIEHDAEMKAAEVAESAAE